jgi:glucoamylase
MESFANEGGLMPEQVWDAADLPEKGLFCGRPSGSAMPLLWAHAEYLKLRRSLQDDRIFDLPGQSGQRYLEHQTPSHYVVWRFSHKCRAFPVGKTLRVEVRAAAIVHWTRDGWSTTLQAKTRDAGCGLHVADLPTGRFPSGTRVEFTFHWIESGRWEGANFGVGVARAG